MTTTQVQTTVPQNAIIGVPGDAYDDGPSDRVTKIATAAVPFGTWVEFSVDEKGTNPNTTGKVTSTPFGGIAMRDPTLPSSQGGYAAGDAMTVMVRGRVFVLTELTVVVTDTPFVRFAAGGGGSQLGIIRNSADTATAVAAPNSKFHKGGGTTAPAVLQLY